MTWFRVDDQFPRHEKYHLAGKDGRALWYAVGVECAATSTDGRVPAHMLRPWAAAAEVNPAKGSKLLVAAGLWHDADTMCARCLDHRGPLVPGEHYFHDWHIYQLSSEGKADPIVRAHELRRKDLSRNTRLKSDIRYRDRDLCRYCSVLTTWGGDRRSPISGTYDHVDPFGVNTLDNVVVACRKCNGEKRDRTPEQWVAEGGRRLLEPGEILPPTTPGTKPKTKPEPSRNLAGTKPQPPENQAGTKPVPRVTRETGRARSGPGSGLVPARSGGAGSGPGWAPAGTGVVGLGWVGPRTAGPGQAGSGRGRPGWVGVAGGGRLDDG